MSSACWSVGKGSRGDVGPMIDDGLEATSSLRAVVAVVLLSKVMTFSCWFLPLAMASVETRRMLPVVMDVLVIIIEVMWEVVSEDDVGNVIVVGWFLLRLLSGGVLFVGDVGLDEDWRRWRCGEGCILLGAMLVLIVDGSGWGVDGCIGDDACDGLLEEWMGGWMGDGCGLVIDVRGSVW